MKLREAIKEISDDEWLAISIDHALIGKIPKKYVTGDILNYEVIDARGSKKSKDYVLHRFLLRDNHISRD